MYYTMKETCEKLNCSRPHIYFLIDKKVLTKHKSKYKRDIKFLKSEVDALLKPQKV